VDGYDDPIKFYGIISKGAIVFKVWRAHVDEVTVIIIIIIVVVIILVPGVFKTVDWWQKRY
jgi:hypothetical protein